MGRKKILIVDDDEMIRMMTGRILADKYDIVSAGSGDEAIRLYEQEKPDMILSDLMMPEMDGFEMMSILREKYIQVIPVMYMTAQAGDDAEMKGFQNGAVDYIRKPFKADVLLHRIDNVLDNLDRIKDLQQAAESDPMTGLYNKTTAAREISKLCKGQGILMMIDLDSFKLVNDLYGHEKGDLVLIWFADTLRKIMRSSDILGRVGGDEFVAYCVNTNDERLVKERTEYLNRKIVEYCRDILGEDMNIPIGVSVGAVTSPDEGTDYQTLFQKADHALYSVKRGGKHGYTFFKHNTSTPEKQDNSAMTEIRTILGERGEARGGYIMSEDEFKIVYRFLIRFQRNYVWDIYFVSFTISSKESEDEDLSDVSERFMETAASCIRGSDVLTKIGSNRVLIIFCKTNEDTYVVPVERIMQHWSDVEDSHRYLIHYEKDRLLPP